MTAEGRDREYAGRRPRARDAGSDAEPRAVWRRWPPVLWLFVYVGSIFILNGANGKWSPLELALGIGLAALACALAMYLALGPGPRGRPRPRWAGELIGGVAAFYAICALAAAIFASPAGAIATLLAGIVPMTAAALWVATTRAKARAAAGSDDPAARADDDPFPGLGPDQERPLGDTPEAHDQISPHDLPPGHPARGAAARQAEALGGATPGHRQGGATEPSAEPTSDLVEEDERAGARFQR